MDSGQDQLRNTNTEMERIVAETPPNGDNISHKNKDSSRESMNNNITRSGIQKNENLRLKESADEPPKSVPSQHDDGAPSAKADKDSTVPGKNETDAGEEEHLRKEVDEHIPTVAKEKNEIGSIEQSMIAILDSISDSKNKSGDEELNLSNKLRLKPKPIYDVNNYFKPGNHLRDATVWPIYTLGSHGPLWKIHGIPWSELYDEKKRLCTFRTFPQTAEKYAISLAANGFAYFGAGGSNDDRVICFFCLQTKGGWLLSDDVNEVHKQMSSWCPMVTNNVCTNRPMRSTSATAADSLDMRSQGGTEASIGAAGPPSAIIMGQSTREASTLSSEANQILDSSVPGPRPNYMPHRFPQYARQAERQLSFESHPTVRFGNTEEVTRAGFFLAGVSGIHTIRCYSCGFGLINWDPSLALRQEHYPDCTLGTTVGMNGSDLFGGP